MFANMSLKFKLIGAFCIVAVVTCAVGLVGLGGLRTTARSLTNVATVRSPSVTALMAMLEGQTQIRLLSRSVVAPAYPMARRQQFPQTLQKSWTQIDDAWKEFESLEKSQEEAALWADCKRTFGEWRQFADLFYGKAQASLNTRSPEELEKVCADLEALLDGSNPYQASRDKLEQLVDMHTKRMEEENALGTLASDRAQAMALSFAVVGVLVALGFGIFLSLNISRRMSHIATAVAEGASNVAAASGQVASSAQSVASGSQEQAASIEETSSSLEELAAMTKQNADNTKTVAQLMNEAKNLVNKAAQGAQRVDAAMKEIKSASDQTSKIIKTIDEIAFQTNLLALNAAVEAARAGEAGKGFAVVAEEVRNLAMRAAEAAKNTGALIEENVNRVAGGVQIVDGLKTALVEVTTSANKVGSLVNEIAAASDEQSKGIEQINMAVTQMNQVTQGNAANAEESASASEEMSGQAESMNDLVNQMMRVINGARGHEAMTQHTPVAHKALVTAHRTVTKAPAKPVVRKAISPEKVIPLNDREELEKF